VVFAVALAAPAAAQGLAAGEAYAGAGYTHYEFDGDETGAVTGRLGYRIHPNFAVEGEAAFGASDGDNAELDNAWGVYAVGVVPVAPSFDLFGRVGYQTVELDRVVGADIDSEGLGYGVGVNWRVSERFGVRGDYTRLDGGDDGEEGDAIGVSATLNF
jgi:hypothetical protein